MREGEGARHRTKHRPPAQPRGENRRPRRTTRRARAVVPRRGGVATRVSLWEKKALRSRRCRGEREGEGAWKVNEHPTSLAGVAVGFGSSVRHLKASRQGDAVLRECRVAGRGEKCIFAPLGPTPPGRKTTRLGRSGKRSGVGGTPPWRSGRGRTRSSTFRRRRR